MDLISTYVDLISTYVDIGLTCLVFKTTYIDRGKSLREGAFFFTRRTIFPPLDKRNPHDKAKDLCVSSESYIGELGVRYLATLNSGQDSRQQAQGAIYDRPLQQVI